MQETFLDKEKIRTMQKDIREAEGISVYPKSNESEEVTQSFILEKRDEPYSEPNLPRPETVPEQGSFSVEESPKKTIDEEAKKAEDLAYELALATNQSEDNIKEKVLQEKPLAEAIEQNPEGTPVTFMDLQKPEEQEVENEAEQTPETLPAEENVPESLPIDEPIAETAEEPVEEQVPETLPVEENIPEFEVEAPEKIPSAKALGLEEAEKIPSARDLGLEEPEKLPSVEELGLEESTKKIEEIKIVDENEEKLSKIAEQTFEFEEALKGINEEKAPFDKRKKEIEDVIDNIQKKLELILEKKLKTDEIKKELEDKEALAQTPEEKRAIEKERWRVEDERNTIEKEKYEKEDEIKSLRLQIRECDLNAEKVIAKEKDAIQQLEILKRDRDRIILGQTKKDLEERLKPLNQAVEDIKREMFENTKQRDKSDKGLTEIGLKEKAVEDEIKILERRTGETTDDVILRDIELRRRNAEEGRRALEKDRWEIEDKVKDMEEKRKIIKEKYQEVSAQIRQIKDELLSIEEKIK
ncbi:hypothetical protein M0Q50_02860 [bacterium]|jgi:hypothetical protein|nr:hypothetical protein [bacterium]